MAGHGPRGSVTAAGADAPGTEHLAFDEITVEWLDEQLNARGLSRDGEKREKYDRLLVFEVVLRSGASPALVQEAVASTRLDRDQTHSFGESVTSAEMTPPPVETPGESGPDRADESQYADSPTEQERAWIAQSDHPFPLPDGWAFSLPAVGRPGLVQVDPSLPDWQRQAGSVLGLPLRATGTFDGQTDAVARELQRLAGLDVTGRVDAATWEAAWRVAG